MSAITGVRRLVRAALFAVAFAFPWLSTQAQAGCGTIVTLNPTDHWVWITIYDVGQNIHLDYGWVAPHSGRKWTAGASVIKYACGSFYHVRYEVKNGKNQAQAADTGNLFDTRMEINPQLTLTDIVLLLHTLGEGLTCIVPGADAACIAQLGLKQGAEAELIGTLGSESTGSVVCIKSNDDQHFWLEAKDDCGTKPAAPGPDKYTFQPGSIKVFVNQGAMGSLFSILKNGGPFGDYNKGRFYTDDPKIATFPDPRNGLIKGVKVGKTTAHWDYQNKRQASAAIEVKQP
jgi:hypothetical protein